MTASLADLPLHDAIHSLGIAGSSTDALGTFHFSLVPPGKYRVHATADDGRAVWSPWFEVEVAGEVNLGALTLIETQEFRWPVFGLEAWGGRYLRLRFRSVTTGEVGISIPLHRSVRENETNLTLRLPRGSWSVEFLDSSDQFFAKLAVIEVNATGAVPALTLPSPAALGLETY